MFSTGLITAGKKSTSELCVCATENVCLRNVFFFIQNIYFKGLQPPLHELMTMGHFNLSKDRKDLM